jgi:hypothetical protein
LGADLTLRQGDAGEKCTGDQGAQHGFTSLVAMVVRKRILSFLPWLSNAA